MYRKFAIFDNPKNLVYPDLSAIIYFGCTARDKSAV